MTQLVAFPRQIAGQRLHHTVVFVARVIWDNLAP